MQGIDSLLTSPPRSVHESVAFRPSQMSMFCAFTVIGRKVFFVCIYSVWAFFFSLIAPGAHFGLSRENTILQQLSPVVVGEDEDE